MRVVQVIADGRPGGGTTAVLTLSQKLKEHAVEIIIVTQAASYLERAAQDAGLIVLGLDFTSRMNTPAIATALTRILRRIQPTHAHAHGGRAGLPLALIRHHCPVIYTVHGFHFRHKRGLAFGLGCMAEALCIARANSTVFVSHSDEQIAKKYKLLRPNHHVIKNAVEVNQYSFHKQYDIGFIGRLHYQKNPLLLVDILKQTRPLIPSLCVIGGGDLESELRERLYHEGLLAQVTITGECDRNTALGYLSRCQTMVLPSRWEGHPISLIEAMLLGIPAVASDIPGSNEIILNGKTGFLVPALDASRYAARLRELLVYDDLRKTMGEAARTEAANSYSVENMVIAYLDVYRQTEQT